MVRYKRKPYKVRQKKSVLKKKAFWYFILIIIIFGTASYFLLFFDKFQIKYIVVSGNNKVSTEEIENLVLKDITKHIVFVDSKSIFLASSNQISKDILSQFPDIGSANVSKRLFDAIDVNIIEREPVFILCDSDLCYFIDDTGVAFENTAILDGYSIVRQENQEDVILGRRVIEENIASYIVRVIKGLNDKFGVNVASISLGSNFKMDIKTNEGWEVYFNLAGDMNLEITKLELLLEKEISQDSRGELKYIDLRFKDKAYYK